MGFLNDARQRVAAFIGGRDYQDVVEFSPALIEALRGDGIGGSVPWQRAIQVSTVLRCAVLRAEEICSVPWKIYQSVDGDRIEVTDHPLAALFRYGPNEWQTSFEFRSTVGLHLSLCGNAYIWLNRVGRKIVEMIPIEPAHIQVCRKDDWSLEYRWSLPDGKFLVLGSKDIWHIRNHSWDAYRGLNALQYARKAIGLAEDIESAQSDAHKNYAKPSGVLGIDQVLDATQFKETRKLIDAQVATRLSRGLPMVIDKTMEWTQLATKATDNQSIESRGFQVEEIARDMGMLPIMLGYSGDKSITYASAEQMFIHQWVHNIRPRHRLFEQSGDKWLLSAEDKRKGLYTGLVGHELLQGDTKARGEFYRLLWMIGGISGNEVRKFEDMPKKPGLDRTWAPLANAPIGDDGMPMVADEREDIDKALQNRDALNLLGDAFRKASPVARQMFLAHLSGEAGPSTETD